MALQSINPYTGETLETFDELSSSQLTTKIKKAQDAFPFWKKTSISSRAKLFKNLAVCLRDKKTTYANTITLEMGKPIKESVSEIEKCAWACDYFAENAPAFLTNTSIETDAEESFVRYDPLGVVLAIMPWNFPFWQVFRFAAPSLMAGNIGLLKHASNVSRCSLHIEDLFKEAGFPENIFQSLLVKSNTVEEIIGNPIVKAVTLTGSEKAGINVAQLAGRNIKKSVLELGGSNAFVVLEDADLEQAVSIGVQARMMNTGQSCIAAKRFIIHQKVADQYLNLFTEKVKQLIVGDPQESTTQIGPLARKDLAEQLEDQVNRTLSKGAKLITGAKRRDAQYEPTILSEVVPGMPAFDEELFGPVAPFTITGSIDEALALANHTSFGLGTTVFTRSNKSANHFIDGIEDGAVFINSLVKSDPRLPFGGTKRSGYGRELSKQGIMEFVNVKTIYIANL